MKLNIVTITVFLKVIDRNEMMKYSYQARDGCQCHDIILYDGLIYLFQCLILTSLIVSGSVQFLNKSVSSKAL
jgi:hypothetical protein